MMLCHVYLYFYGSLTSEGLTFNVSSLFEHRYCEYRLGDLSFIIENVGFWSYQRNIPCIKQWIKNKEYFSSNEIFLEWLVDHIILL